MASSHEVIQIAIEEYYVQFTNIIRYSPLSINSPVDKFYKVEIQIYRGVYIICITINGEIIFMNLSNVFIFPYVFYLQWILDYGYS